MDSILDKLEAGSVTLIDEEGRLGKSWSNVTRHIDSAEVRDLPVFYTCGNLPFVLHSHRVYR